MLQTLFVIPTEIVGVPVFGFGWLLALWAVGAVALMAVSYRRHGFGPETRAHVPTMIVAGLLIAFLSPKLIDPSEGGLAIRGYGVMLVSAVLSGMALAIYRAQRAGLNPEIILSLATWFFISGILGARTFYVVEYWDKFQRPTLMETLGAIVNLTQGGLVVYGSLLAGGAALLYFMHKNKLPGLAFCDLIAPSVVLGVGLGRLGCFMNGCCYGGTCDLPWAVQFPPTSPAYVDQVQRGQLAVHGLTFRGNSGDLPIIDTVEPDSPAEHEGLEPGQRVTAVNGELARSVTDAQLELMAIYGTGKKISINIAGETDPKSWTLTGPPPASLRVHPTQLYSMIDGVLLCLFLLALEPYKRRDGVLTAIVLTVHPISRFLIEAIRNDEGAVFGTSMTIAQNISVVIFLGGVVLWAYLLWREPKHRGWPAAQSLSY